jgi:N-acetylneuraminate synthase
MIHEAKVIAEIGCVHLGSMERAKNLANLAKICGADYAKFQKRNPDECVSESLKHQPHPNQIFSYGKTYLEHRKALELTVDQHREIAEYCKLIGIKYVCSVWDMTSAREIVSINPEFIKVGSPCNNDMEMLQYLFSEYKGDIHISTGMSSHAEIDKMAEFARKDPKRFVLYHCTSIYPCPFEKLHLCDIKKFVEFYGELGIRIGFSNHGYGIAADVAGWILGAEYIERHFVDDRTLKHTDAAASLEPEGLRRLCRDLKNVRRGFTFSDPLPDEEELQQRKKLRSDKDSSI